MSLSAIAEQLKKPPFNRRVTQVELDEKSPQEWMRLVNEIAASLSPDHDVDIRVEDIQDTSFRLATFLTRTLAYKPKNGFEGLKDDLEQMKKPVLQSVALWLLEGREKHEQRVYLAKYLLRIEIPPDILSQDDFLIDANNQYIEAMENFKQTHKAYKELTKGLPDPAPLQEKHEQLEEEIDPNYERLVEAERKYREATEEQRITAQRTEEQTRLQKEAQQRLTAARQKLALLSNTSNPNSLLQHQASEVENLREIVYQKLPQQLQQGRRRLDELNAVIMDEQAEKELEREVQILQKETNEKEAKIAQLNRKTQNRVGANSSNQQDSQSKLQAGAKDMFRSQAMIVENRRIDAQKKMEDKRSEVQRLREELKQRQETVSQAEAASAALLGSGGISIQEKLNTLTSTMRDKAMRWKQQKSQLDELNAEVLVLQRTSELLQARDSNVQELLDKMEEERGIKGRREVENQMRDISRKKQDVDEIKGKMLEEHTQIVGDITRTIAEKKSVLAPAMGKLREARLKYSEVSASRDSKKQSYDTLTVQLESEQSSLRSRVTELRGEVEKLETQYHKSLAEQEIRQITDAKVKNTIKPPDGFRTFKDLYEAKDKELHQLQVKLREQKKEVTDTYKEGKRQNVLYGEMRALLQAKNISLRASTLNNDQFGQSQYGGQSQGKKNNADFFDELGIDEDGVDLSAPVGRRAAPQSNELRRTGLRARDGPRGRGSKRDGSDKDDDGFTQASDGLFDGTTSSTGDLLEHEYGSDNNGVDRLVIQQGKR
ncbi:MAG: putative Intraflagellar transport protein 81 [Streblomastix strix]|uniref:Putative Intraflagellar transport protein 81 n=1 Tax=Streblomastix strix TaxID=222440 RepID=A0A5J4X0L7_9EUKA|nr:MAG: putative Intraflagellar transport protein 81 [Streblomastix strix]